MQLLECLMKGDNQQHALYQVILNSPLDYQITLELELSELVFTVLSAFQKRSYSSRPHLAYRKALEQSLFIVTINVELSQS